MSPLKWFFAEETSLNANFLIFIDGIFTAKQYICWEGIEQYQMTSFSKMAA